MKNMTKRLFSIVCVLALLCAALPVLADTSAAGAAPIFQAELKTRAYTTYYDLKEFMPVSGKEVASMKGTIVSANPVENELSVSDNLVAIIPEYFTGYARIDCLVTYIDETFVTYTVDLTVRLSTPVITYLKSPAKGIVQMKWNKITNATNYTVYYSMDKNFKTGVKSATTKGAVNRIRLSDLQGSKTYYFKVVANAKLDDGVTISSIDSPVKDIQVYPPVLVESFTLLLKGRYGALNDKMVSVKAGRRYQAVASAFRPNNAGIKEVTWSSSNKKVAIINESGLIVTKTVGFSVITAKAKDGGKAVAYFTLNVR